MEIGYITELLFKSNSKPIKELPECLNINEFKEILTNNIKLCSDEISFDYDKFDKMYNEYVSFFNKYRGRMKSYFDDNYNMHRVKPYMIFSKDVWVNKKGTSCIEYYTNRCYKENLINEIIKNRQNICSKESFEERYGDNWKDAYDNYIKKRTKSYNDNNDINIINHKKGISKRVEFYTNKINPETNKLYTIDEAKLLISKKAKDAAEVIGNKRRGKKNISCRQVQYWIDRGYSEEYSIRKVKEIQATNTIEKYVKKYGEQDGISKWIDRNKKWGQKMIDKKIETNSNVNFYSKSSKLLFESVISKLKSMNISFSKIYYAENEYAKYDNDNKRIYFYDFVIPDIKLCVEYNGLMFHPKEGDYNWKCLYTNQSYEEKINYDRIKLKTIEKSGFNTLIVWEDEDFEESVNKIISMCVNLNNIFCYI